MPTSRTTTATVAPAMILTSTLSSSATVPVLVLLLLPTKPNQSKKLAIPRRYGRIDSYFKGAFPFPMRSAAPKRTAQNRAEWHKTARVSTKKIKPTAIKKNKNKKTNA